jgi:protein TonB
MRRPRLRGMCISVLLHGIALGLAVLLLREPAPQALFIDLTHPLEGAAIDGAAASPPSAAVPPAPAAPAARRRAGTRDRTRPGIVREPSPASSAAPAAPSAPAASPPAEPEVAPAPASAPPDVAVSPSPVPVSPEPSPAPSPAPSGSTGSAATGAGTFLAGPETGSISTSSDFAASAPASSAAASGDGGGDTPRGDQRTSGVTALAVPGDGGRAGAEYGAYLALVRRRIQESLRYPMAARRRGLTGSVHVEITVEPSGRIGAVSLVTSSAHRLLDEAALDAVRALPRVPFPPDVAPRSLRVRLPIVFELR